MSMKSLLRGASLVGAVFRRSNRIELRNKFRENSHKFIDFVFGCQHDPYIKLSTLETIGDINRNDTSDEIDTNEQNYTIEDKIESFVSQFETCDQEYVYETIVDLIDPTNDNNLSSKNIDQTIQILNAFEPTGMIIDESNININFQEKLCDIIGEGPVNRNESFVKLCYNIPIINDKNLSMQDEKEKISHLNPNQMALNIVLAAKQSIDICITWITDPVLIDAMIEKSKQGIKVRIISSFANLQQMRPLLSKFTHGDGFINKNFDVTYVAGACQGKPYHCKALNVDNKYAMIGSNNWSQSGWKYNWEMAVFFANHDIINELKSYVDYLWEFESPGVERISHSLIERIDHLNMQI